MKRLLPLLLLPGCYDRHTQLIDAWYPGGRDAAVVDAYTPPPDAFRRPDAFVPRDAFMRPDATFDADLHPARDAVLDGCSGSPNMYAFVSPLHEVVANTIWRPSPRSATEFAALNMRGEHLEFRSGSPFEVGRFPMVPISELRTGTQYFWTDIGPTRCVTITDGEVTIHELTLAPDASGVPLITRFRATFRQECGAEVRRGCVSYTAF